MKLRSFLAVLTVFAAILLTPVWSEAASTELVSQSTDGYNGGSRSDSQFQMFSATAAYPDITPDGRFVAFIGFNLDINNPNGSMESIYVRDRQNGTTELAGPVDEMSAQNDPAISADGRYVAFASQGPLVPEDTKAWDVYVFDRQTVTTERVSIASDGSECLGDTWPLYANCASFDPDISADGRFVVFTSDATNFGIGGGKNVYVRDRLTGVTEAVSAKQEGGTLYTNGSQAKISPDGRLVVFASTVAFSPNDNNNASDIYLYDRQTGTYTLVSLAIDGNSGNSGSAAPAMSSDGQTIAFVSNASNLVAGDTNGASDIFVRSLQSGLTNKLYPVDYWSVPVISGSGQFVAFVSGDSNIVANDNNNRPDVFVSDLQRGITTIVSLDNESAQITTSDSNWPAISDTGRYVAFGTYAYLSTNDTNSFADIYLRDRCSIAIIKTSYQAKKNQLLIEATSELGAQAQLVADGYGPMNFVRGKWSITVTIPNKPATVTVSGPEGSASIPVP